MTGAALKLTAYFGEHDRRDGRLVSDLLLDCCERHGVRVAVLVRGIAGFGAKQHLHTDRQLTLSEDLPLACATLDVPERVEPLAAEVSELLLDGVVTLERARLVDGERPGPSPAQHHEATKLTVLCPRRSGGRRRDHVEVVDILHRHGVAGASVLLGVDGVVDGRRERARFFSANSRVPVMVIAIGEAPAIARALPELGPGRLAALERVRVCKRAGRRLAVPRLAAETAPGGLETWCKLMVHAGEQSRHQGHALHMQLVRGLREAGAAGVTCLRGIWGFSGDHAPHGDRLLSLRRRVPVVSVVVDRPAAMQRLWPVVDAVTDEAGLVTSELVPAYRGVSGALRSGGLRLAPPAG